MDTQGRQSDPSLAEVLFEEGYRFDFFQAVRVLERLYPHRALIGRDGPTSQEMVRFQTRPSLVFPPSDIHEMIETEGGNIPPRMVVAFMGLVGVCGALPLHYTELLIERMASKDFALHDFLNLIDHRLVSIFYRAWEKHHFPIAYERSITKTQEPDRFTEHLYSLIGLGLPGLRGRLAAVDESLLFFAGLLHQRPRSTNAIEQTLTGYFHVPARIRQFMGQWFVLAEQDRTYLGRGLEGASANNALGQTAILGTQVWDQQARFRVQLGPMTWKEFRRLLPDNMGFPILSDLTEFLAGREFDFDVQLILKAVEVPACRLGDIAEGSFRLGWSTWLKTRDFPHDAQDTVISSQFTKKRASSGQYMRQTVRGVA